MPRVIEVIVSPKGETTVQTKGFVGTECLKASKFLEEALGTTIADRNTPDCFTTASVQQQVQQ